MAGFASSLTAEWKCKVVQKPGCCRKCLYLFYIILFFSFCSESTYSAELAAAGCKNQSLRGPLAGVPRLPNRDASRVCALLMQSRELGPRRARPGWKEFMCRRHDKTEHQAFWSQPGSGASLVQLVGKEGSVPGCQPLQSESCVLPQDSPSLGRGFPA